MTREPDALRAPKGTRDVLPPESWKLQAIGRLAMESFARAGYAPIETPVFEHTELFERGVGQASELVTKQMYTFTDLGGRSLTLRPEATASVMRAVLENGLHRGPLPVKLAYVGPMFRQERPQKGRYRQFFQADLEAIGSDDPLLDAEVIELGTRFYGDAGIDTTLLLNSIGHVDPSCRAGYLEVLRAFLADNADRLAPEDRARIDDNPLRTFDSKEPATAAAMRHAPTIPDHLCDACRKHFESVQSFLDDLGVAFTLQPRLVRGLDYYTRTTFEWVAGGLGSQDAVGGGGRYDGLSESLGGPPLPGIGLAAGLDRMLLAAGDAIPGPAPLDAYAVALGDEAARAALVLVTKLRSAGCAADLDLLGRSMKAQMRDAARTGARWALIIGEEELAAGEVTLRDMSSGEQERVALDAVRSRIKS